jgi:hypothetical protein
MSPVIAPLLEAVALILCSELSVCSLRLFLNHADAMTCPSLQCQNEFLKKRTSQVARFGNMEGVGQVVLLVVKKSCTDKTG